jgi:hypothetical protein
MGSVFTLTLSGVTLELLWLGEGVVPLMTKAVDVDLDDEAVGVIGGPIEPLRLVGVVSTWRSVLNPYLRPHSREPCRVSSSYGERDHENGAVRVEKLMGTHLYHFVKCQSRDMVSRYGSSKDPVVPR